MKFTLRMLYACIFFFNSGNIFSQNLKAAYSWTKCLHGSSNRDYSDAKSIVNDKYGNIHVTGYFKGWRDFDPGPDSSIALTPITEEQSFVAKYDKDGNLIWSYCFGTGSKNTAYGLLVDTTGNVYVCGHFTNRADFNTGPDTAFLNSKGSADIFMMKLDSAGKFVWARQFGSNGYDIGYTMQFDNFGYVYLAGYFLDSADFDPGNKTFMLYSKGRSDAFIVKLDLNGNFRWAKSIGGAGDEDIPSMCMDDGGSPVFAGNFSNTVDFDPGIGIYNLSATSPDMFILKLDSAGNFVWAKKIGNSSSQEVHKIISDGGTKPLSHR
jgi:hypothetical protein